MKDPLKIILAEINGSPELAVRQAIKLKKTCEALNLDHPVNSNSVDEFIDILGDSKGQRILLFSNFPPDSSYPTSGKSMKLVDKGDYISRSWKADSYSISQKLFSVIVKRYTFNAIHFITGAHPFMLGDDFYKSLFPDTEITIMRKRKWIDSKSEYQELYRSFVEEKIRDALK